MLVKELLTQGWAQITNFFSSEDIRNFSSYMEIDIPEMQTAANILKRYTYPSDKSDARISNAHMVSIHSSKRNTLPSFYPRNRSVLKFMDFYECVLESVVGVPFEDGLRHLINFQKYDKGSKPVPEHFDGEYLEYSGTGYDFQVREALIPRYVAVTVLYNDTSKLDGIVLTDGFSDIKPRVRPGDVLIFDNVRFNHYVPELDGSRAIVGLRSFDYYPFHFKQNSDFLALNLEETKDLLEDFVKNRWPSMLDKMKDENAVF